jgi:phosphomannomutase
MTRFERDYNDIKTGKTDGIEILRERKAEIDRLDENLRKCRNNWKAQCIWDELTKRKDEYCILCGLV